MNWPNLQPLVDAGAYFVNERATAHFIDIVVTVLIKLLVAYFSIRTAFLLLTRIIATTKRENRSK